MSAWAPIVNQLQFRLTERSIRGVMNSWVYGAAVSRKINSRGRSVTKVIDINQRMKDAVKEDPWGTADERGTDIEERLFACANYPQFVRKALIRDE